jgi:hypothetical protein
MRMNDKDMRRRIGKAVDDLDHALVILRDTIFGLEHRLGGRGLQAEILRLCEDLNLSPELSFSGPVDGALHPGDRSGLLELLRDARPLIGRHFVPARIEITASGDSCTARVETTPAAGTPQATASSEFAGLRDRADRAGVAVDIEPGPDSARISWHVPVGTPR